MKCHGGGDSPAPPVDLLGNQSTDNVTVGAHREHVKDSGWHKEMQCEECHKVPLTVDDEGHIDESPHAEITWGELAMNDGANPSFDRKTARCKDVYCHGTTLKSQGTTTRPFWTRVDGTQTQCGTCHGIPTLSPHEEIARCSTCHSKVVTDSLTFVDPSLHINGVIDVGPSDKCTDCHGNDKNPAPPVDTKGNSDPSLVTVGYHQSHLKHSDWHRDVMCEDCHNVPKEVDDAGHIDFPPADLTWGKVATADGTTPEFFRGTGICSKVYCHGATLTGGDWTEPKWIKTDDPQIECGSCHGIPPDAPHPSPNLCSMCHAEVVDAEMKFVSPALHINGEVNVSSDCYTCHGGPDNPAPPVDTKGNDDTSIMTVGAHQSHLKKGEWHKTFNCTECHIVPKTVQDEGHIDTSPAEITWGVIASNGGVTPSFDTSTGICSETYCHGTTLTGGSLTTPTWNKVDGTQSTCGTCHGIPPESPKHIDNADCVLCHSKSINADNETFRDPELHVNGIVEVSSLECNSCHGSDKNPAPPKDLAGNESTAEVTIGAHQSHLTDGDIRLAIDCKECHKVPLLVNEAGHIDDSPAELTWGNLAKLNISGTPKWTREQETCSNNYCHGATLSGGVNKEPVWTKVDQSQVQCNSCHGFPPEPPHTASTNCVACHPMTVDEAGKIKVADGFHINGLLESTGSDCLSCHSSTMDNGDGIPPNGRRAIVGEFPSLDGDNHAHYGSPLDKEDCLICHSMDTHTGGYVELLDPDDGSKYRFVKPSDLEADPDLSDFCSGCHDSDGAKRLASPTNPFRNGNKPPDVASRFLGTLQWKEWYQDTCFGGEGTQRGVNSHHDISDNDQEFSGAKLECLNCHGSHNVSKLGPLVDPYDTLSLWKGTANDFCLQCHSGESEPADPTNLGFPSSVKGPTIPLRGIESCAYTCGPWFVDYTWSNSTHGPISKRTWTGYSGAPSYDMACMDCHDPHGSYTESNTVGNPYSIKDVVDGTTFVDDGSRSGGFNGPPWSTFGNKRTVVVSIEDTIVRWGDVHADTTNPDKGLCAVCHKQWVPAMMEHETCTACQTCHNHGHAWGEEDWSDFNDSKPCASLCGNGILEPPCEECDDGNTSGFDQCSPTCKKIQ